MLRKIIFICTFLTVFFNQVSAQSKHWQNNDRTLHYTEDKGDFLLVNGRYRFNRALYGNNLASRVEAGDLPEFALYMPGMAGNLQFVIANREREKKLIDADHIETRYRPGAMLYRIKDTLLGDGYMDVVVMAQVQGEGMVVKIQGFKVHQDAKLYAIYGGASGQTFSRNGDIGADPESGFYLLPEYCLNNTFDIRNNSFELSYLGKKNAKQYVHGSFSGLSKLKLSDASSLRHLSKLYQAEDKDSPILVGRYSFAEKPVYIQISKGELPQKQISDGAIATLFIQAEQARELLSGRIKLKTPDRFVNNFGAALAVAADGIWESPTFLHGAVAWRMRLNAWRGAYTADLLGWHDRAKEHFSSYANSQVLEPNNGSVVMDTTLHLARHREKMGTSVFSNGYISRNPNNNSIPHHYDMNLVFIDQLLSHFDYTGDVAYLKQMWPTITRHLNWEKRNFDSDNDGLYDAYCAIWASDGLQYSGGGVTHTTAYNYRANRMAVKLAKRIGEDGTNYEIEANKILNALKRRLWIKDKGYFAEFQDALGNKKIHDKPGIWTIYHIADAGALDDFDNYQNSAYIDNYLPKIPISVKGQEHDGLYTLATTSWQPYTWSVNNVALAENLQAALAFWQSGRNNEAYHLWKSNIVESMYHGISPGNFQQLSHYDGFRGELYRDFADPIGVASRTLMEGLFGVHPRLLEKQLLIKPGFPADWDFAEIELPEWEYKFSKDEHTIQFDIKTQYTDPVKLRMEVPIHFTRVNAVTVNGKEVKWLIKPTSINTPVLIFEAEEGLHFNIQIAGVGHIEKMQNEQIVHPYTDILTLPLNKQARLVDIYDPQQVILSRDGHDLSFIRKEHKGTFFVKLQQDDMLWWEAVDVHLTEPLQVDFIQREDQHFLSLLNQSSFNQKITVSNPQFQDDIILEHNQKAEIHLPLRVLSKGTNTFTLAMKDCAQQVRYVNWKIDNESNFTTENLVPYFNARIADIFKLQYLSPRPVGPTLQLPWQGIGNWCYPLTTANIDASGIINNQNQGQVNYLDIPFQLGDSTSHVMYTSQWDNFPTSIHIPFTGKARKMYLLVTGSTNPMQSQMVNAKIKVCYVDKSEEVLDLINPVNWWPIEQDYLDDGYAFEIPDDQIPYRVKLKTGELYKGGGLHHYSEINGYTIRAIDGGAATLLDMPLNPNKTLKSMELVTEANDVVVGLIGVTLLR